MMQALSYEMIAILTFATIECIPPILTRYTPAITAFSSSDCLSVTAPICRSNASHSAIN